MQLVSENQLETVNCDNINISNKSPINFNNMNNTQNIVNGNDYSNTNSLESNLLDEDTIEKGDISEIDIQPINKLICINSNSNNSASLIEEDSSVILNCNNGSTDIEENDENCNHIDMENDSEESAPKSENPDHQLTDNEKVDTIVNESNSNGYDESLTKTVNINNSSNINTSESFDDELETQNIDKINDTDVLNTELINVNTNSNTNKSVELDLNSLPTTSDEINENNEGNMELKLDADMVVNDENIDLEKSIKNNEQIESVSKSSIDNVEDLHSIVQETDEEINEINSDHPNACKEMELSAETSDIVSNSSPTFVDQSSKPDSCDISEFLNFNSKPTSEKCSSVFENEIGDGGVDEKIDVSENQNTEISKEKTNIEYESTENSVPNNLNELHEHEPMDVEVERLSSDEILTDFNHSRPTTFNNDAMVYIENNIIDQIQNEDFLQKKLCENNYNDEQFTQMEIDVDKTDKFSTNGVVESEHNERDSPNIETELCENTNSSTSKNTSLKDNIHCNNINPDVIDSKDCKISEDKKEESVIIDTLDLLLSDDESEKLKKQNKETSDVKVNACTPLDEDDDLLFISDETVSTKKAHITDDGKIDALNNTALDQNDEESALNETNIVKSVSSILVDDDDDFLVTKKKENLDTNHAIVNNECLNNSTLDNQEKSHSNSLISSQKIEDQPVEDVGIKNAADVQIDNSTSNKFIDDNRQHPIIPLTFMNNFKSNLEKMTRENLEEFCLVKIVEAVIKRSNLSEAEAKLKAQAKSIDVLRKTLAVVTKQNRDLEIVMRNLTNEHKRRKNEIIEPVKISRSVGFQVGSSSLKNKTSKNTNQAQSNNAKPQTKPQKADIPAFTTPIPTQIQSNRTQTTHIDNTNSNVKKIPIVPLPPNSRQTNQRQNKQSARNQSAQQTSKATTVASSPAPTKQVIEKRPLDTSIDLTDDEPPVKLPNLNNSQTKLTKIQNPSNLISGTSQSKVSFVMRQSAPQNSAFISKQLVVHKQFTQPGGSAMANVTISPSTNYPSIPIRTSANSTQRPPLYPVYKRHPAPLPVTPASKIPTNPNWKGLPPKPLLKISRVANGIVISWVMETDIDKRFENIASYQIFAYQETTSPPQSELWKKIGDVKALPLPMACTLTQFMTGYKYYFAVRAVDVRSRIGPFSTPDCIILRNEK